MQTLYWARWVVEDAGAAGEECRPRDQPHHPARAGLRALAGQVVVIDVRTLPARVERERAESLRLIGRRRSRPVEIRLEVGRAGGI